MRKTYLIILSYITLSGFFCSQGDSDDVARLVAESKEIVKSVKEEDLRDLVGGATSEKLDKMLQDKNLKEITQNALVASKAYENEAMETLKACPKKNCKSSKEFSKMLAAREKELNQSKDEIIVFVSSSMPKESLKSLFLEAQKIGARLVFRGLIGNSFKKTQNYFQDLEINADIDPNVFEENSISHVPTFLVQDKESRKKDILKGHISFREALIKIRDHGDLKEIASGSLKKLDGKFS